MLRNQLSLNLYLKIKLKYLLYTSESRKTEDGLCRQIRHYSPLDFYLCLIHLWSFTMRIINV
jgi:hypothetical protein